jgi:hypothetical protein
VEFIVRKKMGSARSSKVVEAASDKAADIILEQVRGSSVEIVIFWWFGAAITIIGGNGG